ncbi:MAG: recombination protein RecR [Candidatus Buchananbacteria bacterium RIFCSPHIGHO2_02_FULL_45_11b]|uniref:Recombination protein RecR n=4 Tax=Candidatus Buchananiibacteriota TaxID=1817903 RepID=A0A1G1Y7Y6_9BACT|nr:MAG: recombination protein RecR [Candidatus Buchananbacteria bacterium RIFCSPHIGHO2_01_FULL_46_12]OGY52372.1 MAG: recombination protein RecR [Candidatus Buchananbacteria bacterium RIFCSPHIGHO2_02_FULL_45_11b]OGY53210.1 MAG: recombination protein RecR [Candidatus Buchananbacteria bacterium RIFCSPLOWO2_01_FULL_45_31]OGY56092.1 MAG: recombination protein RecR [Candidatus Buchananbacteria bacterium RIFCSPLOWO2_02_FULL_46_11b]
MPNYSPSIQDLINQFSALPGLGPKTAQRLVFYLLKQPKENLEKFGLGLQHLKDKIVICRQCHNFSESDPCLICGDKRRNPRVVCVVAKPQDMIALEKINDYQGLYHILGGAIDPLEGITPAELKIKELTERVQKDGVLEIILALSSDLPGETTILYLTKLLKPLKIKITRLAQGLPIGSDLEYADEVTLSSALKGRREL